MKKLLIIGQPDSPHTQNFLVMIREVYKNFVICFYPSSPFIVMPEILKLVDLYVEHNPAKKVHYQLYWQDMFNSPLSEYSGNPGQLSSLIDNFEPDYIHVNAIQDGGYLLDEALRFGGSWRQFKTLLSIWGNDIHYFHTHPDHAIKIKSLLCHVDLIIPESTREIGLSKSNGYIGDFTRPVQATLVTEEEIVKRFDGISLEKKDLILIKSAFQSNRTLNGVLFAALSECSDIIKDYEIKIIAPSVEDFRHIKVLSERVEKEISCLAAHLPHADFLRLLGRARYYATLNLADGVSNTFLECCAAGTFPILSTSASTEDWNSENTILQLDPYNSVSAAANLRELLSNAGHVESAVEINRENLKRYSCNQVKDIVSSFYN